MASQIQPLSQISQACLELIANQGRKLISTQEDIRQELNALNRPSQPKPTSNGTTIKRKNTAGSNSKGTQGPRDSGTKIPDDKSPIERRVNNFSLEMQQFTELIELLFKHVNQQEKQIDDLDQQSRRNCLVLHGCKNVPKRSTPNAYQKLEDYATSSINKHIPDANIKSVDIDSVHVLPSKHAEKVPILIKFVRHSKKIKIFSQKKHLKSTGLVLSESLTRRRLQLLKDTSDVVGFKNTWTWNGTIFVSHNGKRQVIENDNDVLSLKNMADKTK